MWQLIDTIEDANIQITTRAHQTGVGCLVMVHTRYPTNIEGPGVSVTFVPNVEIRDGKLVEKDGPSPWS